MDKFKIRDRVKIKGNTYCADPAVGSFGNISSIDIPNNEYRVIIDDDQDKMGWLYAEEDLELVKENTPKSLSKLLQEKLGKPDVDTKPNASGGIKFDQGKVDYTYLLKDLPVSVEEVTKVLMYGAKKYSRSNYSKVESERYEAAFFRHVMAYLRGEQLDPETGYHHLAHAVCCLMFLVEREVGAAK